MRTARLAVLWLVLFGAYASTLGIDARSGADYAGDEPHHLLVAESIVSDRDLDVADEYAARAYRSFHPYRLTPGAPPVGGRVHDPVGAGFPLLIAPAYGLGGARAVELFLAAVAALGFVLATLLARRLVPEPWAGAGALLVGLSPPGLAYGAAVTPELTAGTLLAGGALCALKVREHGRARYAYGGALLLAPLPWLDPAFVVAAIPVAWLLVRSALAGGRRLAALVAGEAVLGSVVACARVNEVLYGGPTPGAAVPGGGGAAFPVGYLERAPRLVALWLDRGYGLLRWAPVLALAFFAAWLLWRSRRERVADAVPERREAEVAAALLLAVCGAQALVAAFVASSTHGAWFPGRHLAPVLPAAAALAAWGLRHAPRAGAALGALTLAGSAWLFVALRTGPVDGWAAPGSTAPWGPLEAAFPRYGSGSAWAAAVAAAVAAGLVALVGREWWRWRRPRRRA